MGIALIRELVFNQKGAGTLSNASLILKLENVDELSSELRLFDRFTKQFPIIAMPVDQTLDESVVLDLANGLLYKAHQTSANLLNAMTRLRAINRSVFPLTINKDSIDKMHCYDPALVELTERNFIGPTKTVYEYLDGPKWNSRRKVLKKLLQEYPTKDRSILPRIFRVICLELSRLQIPGDLGWLRISHLIRTITLIRAARMIPKRRR